MRSALSGEARSSMREVRVTARDMYGICTAAQSPAQGSRAHGTASAPARRARARDPSRSARPSTRHLGRQPRGRARLGLVSRHARPVACADPWLTVRCGHGGRRGAAPLSARPAISSTPASRYALRARSAGARNAVRTRRTRPAPAQRGAARLERWSTLGPRSTLRATSRQSASSASRRSIVASHSDWTAPSSNTGAPSETE